MDSNDFRILDMMKDGKKISDIQKELKMSRQAIYYRVKQLKKDTGLKESINLDLEKLGCNCIVMVLMKWSGFQQFDKIQTFLWDYLTKNPYVCFSAILLGEWDHLIIFACKNQRDYRDIIGGILSEWGPIIKEWKSIPITSITSGNVTPPVLEKVFVNPPKLEGYLIPKKKP